MRNLIIVILAVLLLPLGVNASTVQNVASSQPKRVVVIDPGHGGPRPGKVQRDIAEKDYFEYLNTNDVNKRFPNGESLMDVQDRVKEFLDEIKEKYVGKTIAIVAHRAPQLAIEVLTKNISWDEALENDWRKTKAWQPGWEYEIEDK